MENRVVSSEESVAEQGYTRERVAAEREQENESIRRLLATKTGREYVLRQLKRAFRWAVGLCAAASRGRSTIWGSLRAIWRYCLICGRRSGSTEGRAGGVSGIFCWDGSLMRG